MSSKAGRARKSRLRAASALVVAVVLLAAATPIASFCCVPAGACCPMASASGGASGTAIGSATPDCCRPTIGNGSQTADDRLIPRPVAPDLATLPIATTVVVALASAGSAPLRTIDPISDPPLEPRAARGPPLS